MPNPWSRRFLVLLFLTPVLLITVFDSRLAASNNLVTKSHDPQPGARVYENKVAEAAVAQIIVLAEQYYQEGEQHFFAGRMDQARSSFDSAFTAVYEADFTLRSVPALAQFRESLVERIQKCNTASANRATNSEAAKFSGNAQQGEPPKETGESDREEPDESTLVADPDEFNLFPLTIDPNLREKVSEDLANTSYGIPIVYNERVVEYLNLFQTDRWGRFSAGLARSGKYLPMMREYFREAGIPDDVIYMAMVESLFNPRAYSRARARGIWQFISSTAKLYRLRQDAYVDERSDPVRSTQAAVKHTLNLYQQFGDWNLVMAAYNAGAGAVQRAIDRAGTRDFWELARRRYLPRETVDHIPAIMASIIIAHNPENYGFSAELSAPIEVDRIKLGRPVGLSVVARLTDLSIAELKDLNPELKGLCTPLNFPEYQLKLPAGLGDHLQTKLKSISVSAWLPKSDMKRPPAERVARGKGKRRGQKTEVAGRSANRRSGKKLKRELAFAYSDSPKKPQGKRIIHKVRKGDNLTKIAARYNTDVQSLRGWNHLPSKKIRPGDKITIYRRE
ncbi:MAG: transglycosylase SLT domain-containing protein [Acidobacteria bacterium]|nr:transglycosylase SLT domain-containing protein [Acidobacteriota bacterium]MBI3655642.1 transglycosylase SLT domain-containing protein [Acidobacteriota bacterium]